ncbi:MAG TPA: DNA adenine methylase [Gemmatimonadaceae bacterium]|nr:DNA adenine methylase [Gemmatimonadaceae bacterium]
MSTSVHEPHWGNDFGGFPLQVAALPETRYMGSKFKLLPFIHSVLSRLKFRSALDAFSGSGSVAYLLKSMGKEVTANDHLHFCYHYANGLVANKGHRIDAAALESLVELNAAAGNFVQTTFDGLYFSAEDNAFLDSLVANIRSLPNKYVRSLAFAAACRACVKRRPRGVFTYVGERYLDGRQDLQLSLSDHFKKAVQLFNAAVFDSRKKCHALCSDVSEVEGDFDLVYLDPPYVSPSSDNDYTRRYHFIEGLVRYWEGLEIQSHTETKKFRAPHTPFRNRREVYSGFENLFRKYADSTIVVSYSSTGIPSRSELVAMMKKYKSRVEVVAKNYSYSFGTHGHKKGNEANQVQEFLFVGS